MAFQGSFTIQNQLDVDTISPYCEITGNLTMLTGLPSITLPNLQTVDGTLAITGASITSVDLPALQTVGAALTVDAPTLPSLTLPDLQTVDGAFSITGASVASADLPALQSVGAAFTIDTPGLTTLSVPALTSLPGGGSISNKSTGLASLTFPALLTIGAKFTSGAPKVTSFSAPQLTTANLEVDAALTAIDLTALQSGTFTLAHQQVSPFQGSNAQLVLTNFVTGTLYVADQSFISVPNMLTGIVGIGGAQGGRAAGVTLPSLQSGSVSVSANWVVLSSFASGSVWLDVASSDASLPLYTTSTALTVNTSPGNVSAPLLTTAQAISLTVQGTASMPSLQSATTIVLSELTALDAHSLTTATSIDAEGTMLTTLSLPALRSLTYTRTEVDHGPLTLGNVTLSDICKALPTQQNSLLTTLDMPLLTQLGATNAGAIDVGDNPALPQCRIDALLAQLGASGWTGRAFYGQYFDDNFGVYVDCHQASCSTCSRPTSPCP
jgi:hypothetical protein